MVTNGWEGTESEHLRFLRASKENEATNLLNRKRILANRAEMALPPLIRPSWTKEGKVLGSRSTG